MDLIDIDLWKFASELLLLFMAVSVPWVLFIVALTWVISKLIDPPTHTGEDK